MRDFFDIIKTSILQFRWLDLVDVLLIATLLYQLIKLTRKTRASQVIKGVGLFLALAALCELIGLTTMSWLMETFISLGAVLLVVLFQPELRQVFEKVGRRQIFARGGNAEGLADSAAIDELQRAILNLSKQKVGALIVFERKTGLRDVMESGIELDARISTELVENVFYPKAPLHDGAMIVRKGMIAAAGCFLPISDNKSLPSELGTRHRAALGISEVSDCIVIIVSEETGMISKAVEGVLTRPMDIKMLRETLDEIFEVTENSSRSIDRFAFKWGGNK